MAGLGLTTFTQTLYLTAPLDALVSMSARGSSL